MLDAIEKLLVLQDRDRRIAGLKVELARIPAERRQLSGKASQSQAALEGTRQQVMHLESERKRLELEIESQKQQIEKYANQQYQTRKNEEFRALGHEIETVKNGIFELENQVLDLMEQTETTQKAMSVAGKTAQADQQVAEEQTAKLNEREANLAKDLAELEANRAELAAAVDDATLSRYERMMKSKETVVVGIDRGVCGGCHMRVSRQTVVDCRAEQAIVTCLNCGRILYYTPEMDVAIAD
jgi:predicted  nucleic acid-binding Zn-ribbon protein